MQATSAEAESIASGFDQVSWRGWEIDANGVSQNSSTGTTTSTHSTTHTLSGNLDDGFTTTVAEAANTVTDETSNGVPSYSESPTS